MSGSDGSHRTLAEILSWHPLIDLAWRAASEAATFLHTQRPSDLSVETKSTPTDVVTSMDKAAEHLLHERLLGERPGDGLLGEEGARQEGQTGIRWIVDPLDGTVNYLYRIPLWGVSVAAHDDAVGEAVVGVIITPETGEGFIGIRGKGAWRVLGDIGERMNVRECTQLSQAMVATGFGYASQRRAAQADVLREVIPSVRDIRRTGCAVVDFTWLARGRTDAYYERGLNAWDVAAGVVIAREAGAVVRNLDQQEPGTFVAAVPGIADALVTELTSAGILDRPH
ncbi:MAG TPA: inositol monophosphatase family protein [Candidatus Nanopelagicales bacterium]|nr:inositol monophosphatase family protein [Candidatus Nanopelagicales bacterium]